MGFGENKFYSEGNNYFGTATAEKGENKNDSYSKRNGTSQRS